MQLVSRYTWIAKLMAEAHNNTDVEEAHVNADELLVRLILRLVEDGDFSVIDRTAVNAIIDLYDNTDKWFA